MHFTFDFQNLSFLCCQACLTEVSLHCISLKLPVNQTVETGLMFSLFWLPINFTFFFFFLLLQLSAQAIYSAPLRITESLNLGLNLQGKYQLFAVFFLLKCEDSVPAFITENKYLWVLQCGSPNDKRCNGATVGFQKILQVIFNRLNI